ncbi:MAG: ATP-binding domain-containing protein [Oscillatoriales cyanobacterium SM2_2_1]|nr:ATP-binding domain-containing protein [Oscillatoriales cyanobacterium SM2_2_1]
MHSSKGLEFLVVFSIGLGFRPNAYSPPAEDARLLYVAMTRSTDRLLTGDRDSEFVKQVGSLLQAPLETLGSNPDHRNAEGMEHYGIPPSREIRITDR